MFVRSRCFLAATLKINLLDRRFHLPKSKSLASADRFLPVGLISRASHGFNISSSGRNIHLAYSPQEQSDEVPTCPPASGFRSLIFEPPGS